MELKETNWQDQHLADVTQIMRNADEMFKITGGSTRHYLRDVFFPMLEEKGFSINKADEELKEEPRISEEEIKREPVTFFLVNALKYLTPKQRKELTNALLERTETE